MGINFNLKHKNVYKIPSPHKHRISRKVNVQQLSVNNQNFLKSLGFTLKK